MPVVCEACESDYQAGPVCPACGTETCARCGWCDECAAQTVTFADYRCDDEDCPGHATPAAFCEEVAWTGHRPDDPEAKRAREAAELADAASAAQAARDGREAWNDPEDFPPDYWGAR